MAELKGLRIATIRGVALKIHISLLFLLIYVILVAGAQFPTVLRQSGIQASMVTGGPLTWGLVFALGLFISVALHEYGHVFVAQSLGVKVKGVTLMMLGGVSEMEKMPEAKYSEFKLSVIGPLVSFAIAGVLFGLRKLDLSANLSLFSYWLGQVNLVLAIFNLLPAFPLDGGRALRSILAARQGTLRATENTVKASKVLAWALGALGFFGLNLILMLIAFFIYVAAKNELYVLSSRDLLKGVAAGEIGIRTVSLRPDDSVAIAAEKMLETRNRILPIETASGPPGLISLNDLRRVPRDEWRSVPLGKIMDRPSKVLDTKDELAQILPDLATASLGALALTENGRIVGIVRYADVSDILQLKSIDQIKKRSA